MNPRINFSSRTEIPFPLSDGAVNKGKTFMEYSHHSCGNIALLEGLRVSGVGYSPKPKQSALFSLHFSLSLKMFDCVSLSDDIGFGHYYKITKHHTKDLNTML